MVMSNAGREVGGGWIMLPNDPFGSDKIGDYFIVFALTLIIVVGLFLWVLP